MQLSLAPTAAGQALGHRLEARRAAGQQRCGAARLVVRASQAGGSPPSLDTSKGLFTSNSSLLGPKPNLSGPGSPSLGAPLSSSKPKQINLDDVELKSGLLWHGRHGSMAQQGPAAVKRGWVYFSEVKFIPVEDMQTLDALWKAASGGKFGYSVQREMWLQARKQWPKFFKAIDWVQGENNVYRKWPQEFDYSAEAPKGHLPLTNALRGTRLFEAIMEHPAFDKPLKSGLRVLLVDEEPSQAAIAAQLESRDLQYSVCCVKTAAEALGLSRSGGHAFDVVLAEAKVVAGDEAVGRSFVDAFEDTPVVLMAAAAGHADVLRAVKMGAVDFLDKPLSLLKLKNIWQHSVRKMMLKAAGPRPDRSLSCAPSAAAAAAGPAAPAAILPVATPEMPTLIKGSSSAAVMQPVPASTDALVLPEGFLTGSAKSGNGPLGLRLRKSPSLLNMINSALSSEPAMQDSGMGLAPMVLC
ncbi:hypothetical protein COHA_006207 [Chlorella ohadii]|uniref:Response regulatory domain-containing protein n=1 Tax=Chlorella ohadii TaxID=2649997 RepID=A0AAD5DLA3_9CHLO|nr:hypothetical protein COHA_006207 [Chlorella ohadii]